MVQKRNQTGVFEASGPVSFGRLATAYGRKLAKPTHSSWYLGGGGTSDASPASWLETDVLWFSSRVLPMFSLSQPSLNTQWPCTGAPTPTLSVVPGK